MFKKLRLMFLILIGMFILSGCGADLIIVDDPLSKKEIVSYAQDQIYQNYHDDVTVKIVSRKELKVCTEYFDGCVMWQKVKQGYSYTLEIQSKEYPDIVATGTYDDGYRIIDKDHYRKGRHESNFTDDYKEKKGLYMIEKEFTDALNEKFDKYYIYKNVGDDSEFDIFINSSDYNEINELLLNFKDTIIRYKKYIYSGYGVYIYKDENVFNNTNFELYNNNEEKFSSKLYGNDVIELYTGKEATLIAHSRDFDYDLFTSNGASAADTDTDYVDYTTFDYIVFLFDGEPNSFVGYNSPSFKVYGVK